MHVTFVGHASFLVESGGVGLLCDPWLVGTAFNDAWLPHPTPRLPEDLLDRVTHLWISHEHPDHLSVPTLKSLPEERRRAITVIYQRHWSPLPARFLASLGFRQVVEVPHGSTMELAPGVQVRLFQIGHEDSTLAFHAGGATLLNLNDCKPGDGVLRALARKVGPIDLLADQFSIAGWPGNPQDHAGHERAARRTLEVLARHVEALEPRMVLPFASFVRFAHTDNAYMNDVANSVSDVLDAGLDAPVAAMYPGDAAPLDDLPALTGVATSRYDDDRKTVPDQPLLHHDPVPVDEVAEAAERFVADIRASYHQTALRLVPSLSFVLADQDESRLDVDVARGEVRHPGTPGPSTVELSSQAAQHTFTERWGFPTLLISGRFRLHGDTKPFSRMKQLGALYSNQIHTRGMVRDLTSYRGIDVARRGPRAWLDLVSRIG